MDSYDWTWQIGVTTDGQVYTRKNGWHEQALTPRQLDAMINALI